MAFAWAEVYLRIREPSCLWPVLAKLDGGATDCSAADTAKISLQLASFSGSRSGQNQREKYHMAPVEVLWWGFSPEHGWVVYDRSIKFNEQQHAILLLLKCSDGTIIAEERKRWNRPHYIFAPRYIDSLPLNERKAKLAELEGLQSKWSHQKTAEIGFQFIREQLFKTLGKIAPGTRPAINRHHRQTHCYNCKSALDSSIDVECIECRWLVCDCGACGCGYLPA